jgi:hypothetical protein
VAYWPYDASLRFELPVRRTGVAAELCVPTGGDGTTRLRRIGSVELPPPVASRVELWWLEQYGGGLFLPLRDATAGDTSYAGGRYLLDSAKGADLGGSQGATTLTIDLNFLYHPSCRYSSTWQCPLAPQGNVVDVPVRAGERL